MIRSRGKASAYDGVTVLTVILALEFIIPSRLKFAPLGGVGSPATVLSLVALIWWAMHQISRPRAEVTSRQPVRIALGIVLLAVLTSFAVAMSRFAPANEVSLANLSLLQFAAWCGLLLVAHDGIPDRDRLMTLCRRLVLGVSFVAAVGLAQRVTGQLLIDRISIPGLTALQSLGELGQRAGFTRPSGTTLHPIEFGALLSMTLPLALNLAFFDRQRSWLIRWVPVGLITMGISLSIVRSAIIGAVVGVIVVAWAWPRVVRMVVALATPVLLGVLAVAVPGLLGALVGMFAGIQGDNSAQSRVGSYPVAFSFIDRAPWFGRGLGTFLPAYRILDNEYLLLLIEIGVVGTLCLVVLFVTAMVAGVAARAWLVDERSRQVTRALVAGVAVGAVSNAFYDGFSFPVATSVLFLFAGLCGAQRRLVMGEVSEEPDSASIPAPEVDATVGRARPRRRRTRGSRVPATSAR